VGGIDEVRGGLGEVDDTGNDADEELRLRVIGVFVMIMLD
jgi:hypothetical protein